MHTAKLQYNNVLCTYSMTFLYTFANIPAASRLSILSSELHMSLPASSLSLSISPSLSSYQSVVVVSEFLQRVTDYRNFFWALA